MNKTRWEHQWKNATWYHWSITHVGCQSIRKSEVPYVTRLSTGFPPLLFQRITGSCPTIILLGWDKQINIGEKPQGNLNGHKGYQICKHSGIKMLLSYQVIWETYTKAKLSNIFRLKVSLVYTNICLGIIIIWPPPHKQTAPLPVKNDSSLIS